MNTPQTQYKQYIVSLQAPLYELVKKETDLRLRYLVLVTNHCAQCLHDVLWPKGCNLSEQPHNYRINTRIYNNFLSIASEAIRIKCEKGINFRRFKKEINEKTIWNALKGYWFHSVPMIVNKHLWIPLLKDITDFYNDICGFWTIAFQQYSSNHYLISPKIIDSVSILNYLHKKFMSCLFDVRCQINQHSNPSGPLVQSACWKIQSFQEVIRMHFDDNNSYAFERWMAQTKEKGGKKMNIPQIVTLFIKPHAKMEYDTFIKSMGINESHAEFQVDPDKIHSVAMFYGNALHTDDGCVSVPSDKTPIIQTFHTPQLQHRHKQIITNSGIDLVHKQQSKFQNEFQFSAENMNTRMHRMRYDQQNENKKWQRQQSILRHQTMLQHANDNNNNNDNYNSNNDNYNNNNNYYYDYNAFNPYNRNNNAYASMCDCRWNEITNDAMYHNNNHNNHNWNDNQNINGCICQCCDDCCQFQLNDMHCQIPYNNNNNNNV